MISHLKITILIQNGDIFVQKSWILSEDFHTKIGIFCVSPQSLLINPVFLLAIKMLSSTSWFILTGPLGCAKKEG